MFKKYCRVDDRIESQQFDTLLYEPLTIDKECDGGIKANIKGHTLFKEITTMPFKDAYPEQFAFLTCLNQDARHVKHTELLQIIFGLLCKSIYTTWNPSKPHMIPHSSGYDSRIISHIIKILHLTYGDNWLGEVKFICREPEGKLFENIMEYQGWSKDKFCVYHKNSMPGKYYTTLEDFNSLWKGHNGPSMYPVSPIFEFLKHLNYDNRSAQIYSGGYFNETFLYGKGDIESIIKWFYNYYYYSFSAGWNSKHLDKHELFCPILDNDITRVLVECKSYPEWDYSFRTRLLQSMDDNLFKLERGTFGAPPPQNKYRVIDPNTCAMLEDNYRKSWYGKKIAPEAKMSNDLWHNPWWFHVISASLCNYLINKGTKIEV